MEERNHLQFNKKRRSTDKDDIIPTESNLKKKMKTQQPSPSLMLILTPPSSSSSSSTTLNENNTTSSSFHLNDNLDLVLEILTRLDGRSLAIAACVCRLWLSISRNDSLWESLCFRHVYHPTIYDHNSLRSLVVSLGGYRSLYILCVRPLHLILGYQQQRRRRVRRRRQYHRCGISISDDGVWTRHGAQLFLSLFCVDYYERQLQQQQQVGGICSDTGGNVSSSLMFLCNPVNV